MQNKILCLSLLCVTKVCSLGNDFLQSNDIELESVVINWWKSLHLEQYIEDPMDSNSIRLCCEAHDMCSQQDFIPVNMQKHGLDNKMKQIATSCSCNKKFVNCLKNLKTISAYNVLDIYLSTVPECFKYSNPINECKYFNDNLRCIKYLFGSGVQKYQWYDMYYSSNENDDGVLGNTSDERSVTGESYWKYNNQSPFPSVFEHTSQRQPPTFDKQEFEQPQTSYYQLPPQIIDRPAIGWSHQRMEQPSQFMQQYV